MKRSIVIIFIVVAAIGIIPLVAQTTRNNTTCPKAQGECQGMGEACMAQCKEGQNCEDCAKAINGECQGCQKECTK